MPVGNVNAIPPPWKLKGTSWVLILSELPKEAPLPEGYAASFQSGSLSSGGVFDGGRGMIQLVSYSESPVGPYNELLYIPGRWKYPNGHSGFRVTRIYTSNRESAEYGRQYWNMPKQVADFDYQINTDGSGSFSVTLPGASSPFFKASIKRIPLITYIPIPFSSPAKPGAYQTMIQPPLPAGTNSEEVATDRWAELASSSKGTMRMMSVTPGFEGGRVGDGMNFPAVSPWYVGTVLEDLSVDIDAAQFYDSLSLTMSR